MTRKIRTLKKRRPINKYNKRKTKAKRTYKKRTVKRAKRNRTRKRNMKGKGASMSKNRMVPINSTPRPVISENWVKKSQVKDDVCVLCLEPLSKPGIEYIVYQFPCGHQYHVSCLYNVCRYVLTTIEFRCPICRTEYPVDNHCHEIDGVVNLDTYFVPRETLRALNMEEYTGESEHRHSVNQPSIQQKGGNQEEKDNYLLDAISLDDPDKVERAINNGADVNAIYEPYGWPALYWATYKENTEIVAILLEKGADVNAKGSYAWTALMKASFNGHTEIVTMLLDNGADVNAKNEHDWTALDWASYNEHTSVVVLLEKAKKVRDNKQKAMELVTNRVEKVPSLQTLAHRNIDTRATMLYNKAVMDSTVSPLGSKLGGKRKTRKSKKSNKRFRTSHKKK